MFIFYIISLKKREVNFTDKCITLLTRLHDIKTNIVNQYLNTAVFVKVYKYTNYMHLHKNHTYTKTKKIIICISILMLSCSRVGHFYPGLFQWLKNHFVTLNVTLRLSKSQIK